MNPKCSPSLSYHTRLVIVFFVQGLVNLNLLQSPIHPPVFFFVCLASFQGGGHSPPKAKGHGAGPGPKSSPEEEALQAKIQEHQQGAARPSHTEGEKTFLALYECAKRPADVM